MAVLKMQRISISRVFLKNPPIIILDEATSALDNIEELLNSMQLFKEQRDAEIRGGERTAEDIKIKVGSAVPLKDELDVEVNGRDVITGLPKTVRIESEEIRRALNKPLDEMAKAVKDALDATPPDLASDLMYYGILLTGGGALLKDLDRLLMEETGLPVVVADDPLSCVVRGCGIALEGIGKIEDSIFCFG